MLLSEEVRDLILTALIRKSVASWDGATLKIQYLMKEFSNGRPLTAVVLVLLECFGCIKDYNNPPKKYINALQKIQGTYNPNAYHSVLHAVDVVLAQAVMLLNLKPGQMASPNIAGLIMAAAGHDVGHSAVSNTFLKASGDPRATAHENDPQPPPCGPNEMAHFDTCLEIFKQEDCNWLKLWPAEDASKIMKVMEDAIHKTDMALHDQLLKDFLGYVELYGTDFRNWKTEEARECFRAYLLHAADISNGVKDIAEAAFWAGGITIENKDEGDRLKELKPYSEGTPLPEQFDRAHIDVPKSQVFFLTRFLIPTFEALALVMPTVGAAALKHGKENLAKWQAWQEKGVKSIAECLKLAGCRARKSQA